MGGACVRPHILLVVVCLQGPGAKQTIVLIPSSPPIHDMTVRFASFPGEDERRPCGGGQASESRFEQERIAANLGVIAIPYDFYVVLSIHFESNFVESAIGKPLRNQILAALVCVLPTNFSVRHIRLPYPDIPPNEDITIIGYARLPGNIHGGIKQHSMLIDREHAGGSSEVV